MKRKNSILDAPLGFPKGNYGVDDGVLPRKLSDRIGIIKDLDISPQAKLVFFLDEILEKARVNTLRKLFHVWMYGRKSKSDYNVFRPENGERPALYFIDIDIFKDEAIFNYGLESLEDVAKKNLSTHPIFEKNKPPVYALSQNLLNLIKKCTKKSPIVTFTIPELHQLLDFDVREGYNSPGKGYPSTSLRVATFKVSIVDTPVVDFVFKDISETASSLGTYNLNLFAGGKIELDENGDIHITYEKFAYFFVDYFDFEGDKQTLGVWSAFGFHKWKSAILYVAKKFNIDLIDHPNEITNDVMRQFKEKVVPKYNESLESGKWSIPEGIEESKLIGCDFKLLSPVVPFKLNRILKTIKKADLTV